MSVCATDFFAAMPPYATEYAIPAEYTRLGLVKRGRNALAHQWAAQKLAAIKGSLPARVVTVFLNDRTDVAALKDGEPVMSSHGYSENDGIMSRTGCGAVDTSIVFQLFAAGYSPESIEQLLSQESGFKALAGKELGLSELLAGGGLPAEIFSYQVRKTIGACAAALEGIDAVVFIGDDRPELRAWAGRLFGGGTWRTPDGSPVGTHYFVLDPYALN